MRGITLTFLTILFLAATFAYGQSAFAKETSLNSPGVVGEAFGEPVTREEFLYYFKTATLFTRTGTAGERGAEAVRNEAWQNIIYSREAERLGVKVSPEELESELERLVSEKGLVYGTEEYYEWVAEAFGEDPSTFEKRIEDLLMINKFLGEKTNPDITVTEEEMKQKFLNQYNSFESEYIMFDSPDEAETFVKKVRKDPSLWLDEYTKKRKTGQKGAAWINIMSLEALIDLWKIPKEDAYNILSHEKGDFIAAENYYGPTVFRLLFKKEADLSKYDEKKKEYYNKLMTKARRHKKVKGYFEDLLKRASYRDYVAEKEKAEKIDEMKQKRVILKTSGGDITLEFFPEAAPLACENFMGLVEKGYYDGTVFHRVVEDFMIQGGDPTATGTGGESIWERPFADEATDELTFDSPGILAMANSGPDTNKSQFFITVKEAPHLNGKHTIFGKVIEGYEVVEKISEVPTDSSDRPKEEQRIVKALAMEHDEGRE